MFEQYIEKAMALGNQIMLYGAKLEAFLIPAVILGAIALLVFSRYSYKCFKIVLPVAAIILGSTFGVSLIQTVLETDLVKQNLGNVMESVNAVVGQFINPLFLAGIVIAIILAIFCFKFTNFTVLLLGASAGYVLLGRVAKDFILSFDFVTSIVQNTDRTIVAIVGILVGVLCMLVCAFLVNKFFRPIYIVVTSVGAAAAALGLAAMFAFATTDFTVYATLAGAGVGTIVGIILSSIQFNEGEY